MSDKSIVIKEVRLNNHCPECYSNEDLILTLNQTFVENGFFRAFTKNTTHSLSCNKCNTEIFPIRWTDNIEQVVDYHIKATTLKPKSLKLKKLAWGLITIVIVIVIGAVFLGTGMTK